jgi:hypothetical protein
MDHLPGLGFRFDIAVWRDDVSSCVDRLDGRTRYHSISSEHIGHDLHGRWSNKPDITADV